MLCDTLIGKKSQRQRKDGLYYARFVNKTGKRHETYFNTLPEARNWIENIVGDLAPNTLRNDRERYKFNIQPIMGKMAIANVKPMQAQPSV